MKILLDESLDIKLKNSFIDFDVHTVKDMGWLGIKNGQLLTLADNNGFDVFLTADRNIQHQQNLTKYNLKVVAFKSVSNDIRLHIPLIPEIIKIFNRIEAKQADKNYFEI